MYLDVPVEPSKTVASQSPKVV
uniref:Uncharacterized protein n=1 Tax=Anguilla anguilla TaxID=7936 RepID=A0A0E9W0K7_ANGAN